MGWWANRRHRRLGLIKYFTTIVGVGFSCAGQRSLNIQSSRAKPITHFSLWWNMIGIMGIEFFFLSSCHTTNSPRTNARLAHIKYTHTTHLTFACEERKTFSLDRWNMMVFARARARSGKILKAKNVCATHEWKWHKIFFNVLKLSGCVDIQSRKKKLWRMKLFCVYVMRGENFKWNIKKDMCEWKCFSPPNNNSSQ